MNSENKDEKRSDARGGSENHQLIYDRNHPRGYRDRLTDYDREGLTAQPYRPGVIIFVTEPHYVAEGAWAHTEPRKRTVCRLRPERTDPYLPVDEHEIEHNIDPDAPEHIVHDRAYNRARSPIRRQITVEYR